MSNKKSKKASTEILTREQRARALGLSNQAYVLYRVKDNLQRWVESAPVNIIIAFLILFSVVLIIIEFLLPVNSAEYAKVHELNNTLTWIFIGELSVRYLVAPNKRIYLAEYWLDILSVVPAFRLFRTLRVLRLLRLLRLARAAIILVRQSGWLSHRLERYFGSFGFLLLTAFMLIICASVAILSFERVNPNEAVDFNQLVETLWATTLMFMSGEFVGEVPHSSGGKLVTVMITLSGLVIFAIMVGTISATMTNYFRMRLDAKEIDLNDLKDHLIICGWDRKCPVILRELEEVADVWRRGVVVVSETVADIFEETSLKNSRRIFHLREDFTRVEVLELAGAARARTAIVLAESNHNLSDQDRDARTVLAALTLEKLNPKVFTCAEILDEQNATHLRMAGVEEIISRTALSAGLFASSAINEGISPVISDILTHREGSYFKKIMLPESQVGKPFLEVFHYFKDEYDATAIAIETLEEDGKYHQHVNPSKDQRLSEGCKLTLILKRDSVICDL